MKFSVYVGISALLIIEICCGTGYAFGLFSPYLKESMKLTQSSLQQIASFGSMGLYLSVIGGVFFVRFGFLKTVLVGATGICLGFTLLSNGIWRPEFALFLAQHGSAWVTTGNIASSDFQCFCILLICMP